jgi:hypothetical protein
MLHRQQIHTPKHPRPIILNRPVGKPPGKLTTLLIGSSHRADIAKNIL